MPKLSVEMTPAQADALLKHLKKTVVDDQVDDRELLGAAVAVELAIHPPKRTAR